VLRELRADDAEAVAAVICDATPHRTIDAEEVRSWLTQGLIDPDDIRVLEEDGSVVGYVDIFVREDLAYLDPNGTGREAELLGWAEERARAKGVQKVRLPVWQGQDDFAAALERRGYDRVRSSFEMLIELGDEPPPAPEWPSVCLAFPERVGDPALGWISILGVRRRWRRRGLGEALLRHAIRTLHARGLRRAGLGVDAESPTGATRLYERVGMRVAVRSDSWDKQL